MKSGQSPDVLTSPRLRFALGVTAAGLWLERLLQAFWAALALAAAAFGLARLGLIAALPPSVGAGLLLALALSLAGLVWRGFRHFRRPRAADVRARLDARLPGAPLAALHDAQALGRDDPASAALWALHLDRMAKAALGARPAAPRPDLPRRDPFALRLSALLLLVVGLTFGSGHFDTPDIARPPGAAVSSGPLWEGWLRPPPHSGRGVIYLNELTETGLEVPEHSTVSLRFYAAPGALRLSESVSGAETPAAPPEGESLEFSIRHHGEIRIEGENGRAWEIGVLPDLRPFARLPEAPERQADGRMILRYEAEDDYAVTRLRLTITPDLARTERRYGLALEPEPRPPLEIEVMLPPTGRRQSIRAQIEEDLSAHPFAGLPVEMVLRATDQAGQSGESEPLATLLPGRRFFDPLAGAVAELRRDLLWSAANAPSTAQLLRALTWKPDEFIRNERLYLRLRAVLRGLESGPLSPEARDELAGELWSIALLLEEGDLNSALERLRRAQDRLDEAMRNGASPSEIRELMAELREAMDAYMEQLTREQERAPSEQTADTEALELSASQLDDLLARIEQLMAEGKMAEAQELMEMLRQLMENMQVTQGEGGQGRGEGAGAMRDLSDTLRRQQELSDEAFGQLQRGGEGGAQPGESEGEADGRSGGSLADRQRDLKNQLRALGQTGMPGDGSPEADAGRQALDRSREAMEGAEEALRGGDLPRALDRQAEAMEQLRDGMRRFDEAARRERAGRPGDNSGPESGSAPREGQSGGRGRGAEGRDPLGRPAGADGASESGDPLQEGLDPGRRAMDLLEELRRRSGEAHRPDPERDYLRRLLDPW